MLGAARWTASCWTLATVACGRTCRHKTLAGSVRGRETGWDGARCWDERRVFGVAGLLGLLLFSGSSGKRLGSGRRTGGWSWWVELVDEDDA
jgi:hypothetical protein